MNVREWLNQEPDVSELVEVSKGVYTHPYDVIVKKLYQLCPDGWDTKNFQHQFFTLPDGRVKVSGSIEVVLEMSFTSETQGPSFIRRTLSGAATFTTTDYSTDGEINEHFAATVKSLAIVNAVQVLGRQFGLGLNSEYSLPVDNVDGQKLSKLQKRVKDSVVKLIPDAGILKQFEEAVKQKNGQKIALLLSLYEISIEGRDDLCF